MQRFKFKSKKRDKLNLIRDAEEISDNNIIKGAHTEIFLNKRVIIEGCQTIVDYQENYIKLKLKKGFISLTGIEFIITSFDEEKIDIKGKISTIEFCI